MEFLEIQEQNLKIFLRILIAIIFVATGLFLLGLSNTFFLAFLPLIIAAFFIEQYYTSPATALANTFAVLLLLLSQSEIFIGTAIFYFWLPFVLLVSILLILSFILKALQEKDSDILNFLRKAVGSAGASRVLYPLAFLLFLTTAETIPNESIAALTIAFVIALFAKEIHKIIDFFSKYLVSEEKEDGIVGSIIAIQGETTIKLRLNERLSEGTVIEVLDKNNSTRNFVITNLLALDKDIIAEAILINGSKIILGKQRSVKIAAKNKASSIIGKISDGSNVNRIIFEPFPSTEGTLEEGDVVVVDISYSKDNKKEEREVLYQIIDATTSTEELAQNISRRGIFAHAEQLGFYNEKDRTFEPYGWTPQLNQLVKFPQVDKYNPKPIKDERRIEHTLGFIPKIKIPVFIDLISAVTHHTALLGVTGSGKSFLAHELISEIEKEMKVVCIDFTGEYKEKLTSLNPVEIIDDASKTFAEKRFNYIEEESKKSPNAQNKSGIATVKDQIKKRVKNRIETFLQDSDNNVGLFELPGFTGTTSILSYTEIFLGEIFQLARDNEDQRICIVLEEAHTIIPETNFLGEMGDYGSNKQLVSRMSQIALQGRKYGVGLLVIAQRSANVSKTVLTQCNTVICLQSFDTTTKEFMSNYTGTEFIKNIQKLKQYHAVVHGKAIGSNRPIILDLTRKESEEEVAKDDKDDDNKKD
tara:strand:- start:112953 stop:115052 length:2100 start_codon:yes stop_codon:yes gene_type:complete